jgi:hypothetical protein
MLHTKQYLGDHADGTKTKEHTSICGHTVFDLDVHARLGRHIFACVTVDADPDRNERGVQTRRGTE